jgi:pSer/pThr/pTyr-binding forkhead associated (FHA) protein
LNINLPHVSLRDLNSLNGTRVNGSHVDQLPEVPNIHESGFSIGKEVMLSDQDEIEVGNSVLRVEVLEDGPDTMMICEETVSSHSMLVTN